MFLTVLGLVSRVCGWSFNRFPSKEGKEVLLPFLLHSLSHSIASSFRPGSSLSSSSKKKKKKKADSDSDEVLSDSDDDASEQERLNKEYLATLHASRVSKKVKIIKIWHTAMIDLKIYSEQWTFTLVLGSSFED